MVTLKRFTVDLSRRLREVVKNSYRLISKTGPMGTTNDYFSVAAVPCVWDTTSVSEGGTNALKIYLPTAKLEQEENACVFACFWVCFSFGQAKFVCVDVSCRLHLEEELSDLWTFFALSLITNVTVFIKVDYHRNIFL